MRTRAYKENVAVATALSARVRKRTLCSGNDLVTGKQTVRNILEIRLLVPYVWYSCYNKMIMVMQK